MAIITDKKTAKRAAPVKSYNLKRDANGKFTTGSGGLLLIRRLNWKRIVPVLAIIGLAGGFLVYQSFATSGLIRPVYDLKSYYPNNKLYTTQYLEGNNYITEQPSRSVLWFERQDQYTFKMYNAAPQNSDRRCNYDILSWWPDKTLRYSQTVSECQNGKENKIVYDASSPIVLLPSTWKQGSPWKVTSKTSARYYEKENGKYVLKCTGTNNYVSEILGIEKVTPNEEAIRWRTTQTTSWGSGKVEGKCYQGYRTRWQENYWLSDTLKAQGGGTTKGLRRTQGGNLEVATGRWDIWFDGWAVLPKSAIDDTQPTGARL